MERPGSDVIVLPEKKRDAQSFYRKELDKKVINMIKSMRESGAVINYNIMIAIANGLIQANDRTLLREYGGTIELGTQWCQSISYYTNIPVDLPAP